MSYSPDDLNLPIIYPERSFPEDSKSVKNRTKGLLLNVIELVENFRLATICRVVDALTTRKKKICFRNRGLLHELQPR